MAGKEQYLTEQHYLNCDKGMMPKKVSITSQNFVKFSGVKAATVADRQEKNNFICLGSTMFAAGAVAGLACCFIPGPGWAMAAIIAAALIIAAGVGVLICKSAAATRLWEPTSVALRAKIEGKQLLLLSSCMVCPSKGGMITASATVWEAWGKQALTNLGHLGNFAFGFLAGRGAGGMVAGAGGATNGVITKEVLGNLAKQGWKKSSVEFLKIFGQTAKEELIQQFNPLKGWKKGSFICNVLRGFGLYGAYKQQLDIWLDKDKSILEKAEASAVGLILDIFAAKGMTYTCFPAGTKVHTQWGLANIESLEEGVPVLTYNISTGEKEYKPVLKTIKRTTPRMCILELSNKETLFVTPEHRFFTHGNWIEVGDMQVGDLLQTKENEYLIIEDKIIISNLVDVYNIEVSDNENYYVTEEGILVHNGCRTSDELLEGEGKTGSYKELIDDGKGGDNITPHHMPSDEYMSRNASGSGYTRNEGLCMNMEQPHPGSGGRHRDTATYDNHMTQAEKDAYYALSPRDALAHDIKDVIKIYKRDGLYNDEIRNALKELIKESKKKFPDLFKK